MRQNRLLLAYNPDGCTTKGPHKLVAPHELSSELLFRMRRQNRASPLARLDQPKVLRPVFRTFREDALASRRVSQRWAFISWIADRARVQAQAAAARNSTHRYIIRAEHSRH